MTEQNDVEEPEEEENHPILTQTPNRVETGRETLPPANRNAAKGGSLLEQINFPSTDGRHPAQMLFEIVDINDLLVKSDIPEKMVPIISKMLWTADRYDIQARTQLVKFYLLSRIGKERMGRDEFLRAIMSTKNKDEDDDLPAV